MKCPGPWEPRRKGLFFILERCEYADFLGAGYKWLRYKNGFLRRFWTHKQAQAYADKINRSSDSDAAKVLKDLILNVNPMDIESPHKFPIRRLT